MTNYFNAFQSNVGFCKKKNSLKGIINMKYLHDFVSSLDVFGIKSSLAIIIVSSDQRPVPFLPAADVI